MWEKQELSLGSVNEVPTFRVEYFKDNEVFPTQADKKSAARKKLLGLMSLGWMRDMEFTTRYCLDETFISSITRDSIVCYVDDSFLVTVANKQISINGKADGPGWNHTFQYASIVSDIPCIVTTTTENRRTAMHLFYGNDRYDIPNCKHISVSPGGAVWWIDVRGKEYHTTLHDLRKKTAITEENTELPGDLVVTAIHTASDGSRMVFGTQPGDQQRSRKLFKDGIPMDIRELASIKELEVYSFEGDILYLKYTDFANHPWKINIHLLSERVRKDENNPTINIQRKTNRRLGRIIEKIRWKNEEWSADIEKQQSEIQELKRQLSALKREREELQNTNNRLSAQNTELRSYIWSVIESLATAMKSRTFFGISQLPFTAKWILKDHAERGEKPN